jgi:endonuclease/exonuclease/phosphatase family metal-dependent hydrolase
MSHWSDVVLTEVVPRISPVSAAERAEILKASHQAPSHGHTHDPFFDRLTALREIEAGGVGAKRQLGSSARIAFWNVERLRHIDAISATLKSLDVDVAILCEVDRGMARTQNQDRIVDLAGRLGCSYLYAVEFVELGLGDAREQVQHAGESNSDGFHGAGLLSPAEMSAPFLIRLDRRGNWFDGAFGEPRVGGTIAIGAKVQLGGVAVTVVSVHLESHCDPDVRGEDMRRMLALIDTVAAGEPVILGGDFNTSTAVDKERRENRPVWLARLAAEPQRLSRPEPFEPLFGFARDRGYDWHACNVPDAPTQRFPVGSDRPNAKLDWFFTRGLVVSDPRIIPAVQDDGAPSSDHEALVVTIAPLPGA